MPVEYVPAPEVKVIAERLIGKHHDHIHNVRIEYLFRDKHQVSGGKEVWAKARKISGLNAYLAGESEDIDTSPGESFFVLEVALDIWSVLSPKQREALVDHELCHFGIDYGEDGEAKLVIRPHDLEEFKSIVERHGLWKPDVTEFLRAAKEQLTLLDEAGGIPDE